MKLVFLHGAAAAGKLTVAEALHRRTGYPVFHNHLVVDLLTTVFPFGSEPFVRLREEFWLAVVTDAASAGRSLTFTFSPESTVRAGFPGRVDEAVTNAGGRVCFVELTVSEAEQERRIGAESRRRFHKLTDVTTLRALRGRAVTQEVDRPPAFLSIETDTTSPDQAADIIIDRFGLQTEATSERYPS